jgi:hypothetical protein
MHREWVSEVQKSAATLDHLTELRNAIVNASETTAISCVGLFRIIGCLPRTCDGKFYSFSELDSTSMTTSMNRFSPVGASEIPEAPTRPHNCVLQSTIKSSLAGVGVVASSHVARQQFLVLDCGPDGQRNHRSSLSPFQTTLRGIGTVRRSEQSPTEAERSAFEAVSHAADGPLHPGPPR